MKQIVLLTDFGLQDHYVGVMKGVISKLTKSNNIIDLSHNINSQKIIQAAFILSKTYNYFSNDIIFCCVVDPGVGSDRKILIIKNDNQYFVAPDNGLLSGVISDNSEIYLLNNQFLKNNQISNTFHGRDIFAPIAAEIYNGNFKKVLGEKIIKDEIVKIQMEEEVTDDYINGRVMNVDIYGNIVTNINGKNAAAISSIVLNNNIIQNKFKNYSEANNEIFFYIGSCNTIEIAIKNSSANKELNTNIGDSVVAIKKGLLKSNPS